MKVNNIPEDLLDALLDGCGKSIDREPCTLEDNHMGECKNHWQTQIDKLKIENEKLRSELFNLRNKISR